MSARQPLRELIASEVRAQLARRRIPASELAKRVGKSQTYIWRRLAGQTAFDADDLERIAETLGIAESDLIPQRAAAVVATAGAPERVAIPRKPSAPVRTGRTGYPGNATPDLSTRRPAGFSLSTRYELTEQPMLADVA